MIGGDSKEESIMVGIIVVLTPAPLKKPFPAWKPLIHPYAIKTQLKAKNDPSREGDLGALSCVFMA